MQKVMIIGLILIICMLSISASAAEPDFFNQNGFVKMRTTAYCCGTTTANGSAVHFGGCAAAPEHMGDIAIVYLPDGYYVGMFECNDLGGTEAIRTGKVLDIYFPTLFECKEYMRLVGTGKIYVKYIHGNG